MKRTCTTRSLFLPAALLAAVLSFTLVFSKDIPPKKINAKLECKYETDDGTQFRYPGNGVKEKPRLEGTLFCWISIPKIPDGVTLEGTLKANGKPQQAEAIPRPDDSYSIDATFSSENGDFNVCSAFTVTGEVTGGGKTVWKGRLPVDQRCPD
jgi:hypothetical protein